MNNNTDKNAAAVSYACIHEALTLDEICKAVDGKAYGTAYCGATTVYADEISSDTRSIVRGALFIGIRGENFNGNDFAEAAVKEYGAVCAVTDRILNDVPCIVVKDTRKALLDLAAYFRCKFRVLVTGVTGSVGKTMTKEMVFLAMSSKHICMKTLENKNNEIGLPFTLLNRLDRTKTMAVIEMGMSYFGEISRLSHTAKPDICIITNIGYSHIGNLGSREGILKAKLEILNGASPDAPLIVNGDDDMLRNVSEKNNCHRVVLCGISNTNADYRAENIVGTAESTSFDIIYKGNVFAKCTLPMAGKHFVIDALLAIAAACEAGCEIQSAADMLKELRPTGLRQHFEKRGEQTLIVDCYNAAPDSVIAAIDVLVDKIPEEDGRKICVLGDMLELGKMSEQLHREVGEYMAKSGVDMAVCVGDHARFIADSAVKNGMNCKYAATKEEAVEYLRNTMRMDDVMLFKGSRGMKMEKIIEALYG